MPAAYYTIFLLVVAITFIIWSTAIKKVNAFFALLIATLGVGIFSGMPLANIVTALRTGFGHTMEKIGLLIILGTTLGVILEKTGATVSMANAILRRVKEKNAALAISITGFIIGIPIFCDSGFIILSGLNHSLVRKTKLPMTVMAASLASSLMAVHCLVPPHPGITAATGTLAGDLGTVMLWGILLSMPAAAVGYVWSAWRGKMVNYVAVEPEANEVNEFLPSASLSFIPIILPIALIAIKSLVVLYYPQDGMGSFSWVKMVAFTGEPVIALSIAILVSLALIKNHLRAELQHWLSDGVHKAGMILAIVAAGGMFGEMLQATGTGKTLGDILHGWSLGIFLPFLMTVILKTAQGSSTIAVITAASLITPLLSSLGLQTPMGITLTILSMGAGSMIVSHANDAFFWVITRFSNLPAGATLKVFTMASLLMGITVQMLIWAIWVMVK